jgi:hypothetical protein
MLRLLALIRKIKVTFQGFWIWVKKNWKTCIVILASTFTLIGLLVYRNRSAGYALTLKKLDIVKGKQEIDYLKSAKDKLALDRVNNENQIKDIDSNIQEIDKKIEKDRMSVAHMTIDEKLKKFDDLGYK